MNYSRRSRRKLHRSKSVVRQIFQQHIDKKTAQAEEEDPRTKNIRQVEFLIKYLEDIFPCKDRAFAGLEERHSANLCALFGMQ